MRYSEGSIGRVFILRLEDGDILNDTLETFARQHAISRALAFYVGGSSPSSQIVVGPDATRVDKVIPLIHSLERAHETMALGTVLPNENGEPVAHMHVACGREGSAAVGCARAGLQTWLVGEVVVLELLGVQASRTIDPNSGFELLSLG